MASYSPQEEALRTYNPLAPPPRQPQMNPISGLRGGEVSHKPGMGPGLTGLATGVGAQIAGGQVANALTGAGGSPAWASGAAGMGLGMGINMAGNAAANKLKPKEEMPTFGGRHAGLTDQYGRRYEGAGPGLAGGAVRGATLGANPALLAATGGISAGVGALGGLVAGMATKNATSAYSDFSATDGGQAIKDAYKQYLGRDASDQEVMTHLQNQGYDPSKKDRWVGEKGLYYVLDQIQDSPEAQAYRAQAQNTAGGIPPQGQIPPVSPPASPQSQTPTPPQNPAAQSQSPTATSPGQSYTSSQQQTSPEYNRQYLGGAPSSQGSPGLPQLQPDGTYSAPTTPKITETPASATTQSESPAPPSAPGGPPSIGPYGLEGYVQSKLESGHDSPKYLIGRTLSQFDPSQGLTPEAIAALNALGIGTFSGQGDKLTVTGGDPRFNGLSQFDVARDYTGEGGRTGSSAWQFAPDGPEAQSGQPQFASGGGGYSPAFQAPQLQQGGYSDDVIRYLLSQMGLDRAATSMGG